MNSKNIYYVTIFILVLPFYQSVYSQTVTLSGKIKDATNNDPLPFANLTDDINRTGAISDKEGFFNLVLKKGAHELKVSYVGYKTQTVSIENLRSDSNIIINLYPTNYLFQTVTVYSSGAKTTENEKLSNISLQSERVAEMSTVFRDVFRSLQSLPGISVNNELSAKFNVRGGNFDENLVLVNGAQVYEPFHIKEATEVSIGIFNVDLMKKVDLMTGGFSAEFGDKMSSVLNIEYREGNREKFCGSASFSLASLDVLAEGPISESGSFMLGLRKSYFEYLMSYFSIDDRIHPSLYDIQGEVSYHLSSKDKLLFQFIHSGDKFTIDPELKTQGYNYQQQYKGKPAIINQKNINYNDNQGNYYSNLFDIQLINLLSGKMILKTEISYYYQIDEEARLDTTSNRTDIYSEKNYFSQYYRERKYTNNLEIKTIEGKTSLNFQAASFYEFKFGLSYRDLLYHQDLLDYDFRKTINTTDKYPDTNIIGSRGSPNDEASSIIETKSYKVNGYIENLFLLNENIIANIGVRIDYFDFNKDLNFSPRVSLSYKSLFGPIFRAAWGYYFQSPTYSQLRYSFTSDSNTKAQRAIHYILGAEHTIPFGVSQNNNITFKIEAYYKKYEDLISSDRSAYWRINYSRRNDATGFAQGVDLFLSLSLDGFYGWLSYGLLSTKEEKLSDNGKEFPRYTDQTHTISVVTDFDLGKEWSLNLRLFYGSGYAYTPYSSSYNSLTKGWTWITGEKNSAYLPAYKRVDTRLSKPFKLFNFSVLAFLDVTNLLNFKNIMSYRYSFNNDGTPKIEEIKLFPIIPSIGITIKI
jgi:hypothetical protein